MTTWMRQTVRCWVCGASSAHEVLGSTNTMGGPDLDLRPGEMMRSTMEGWLQECPDCGFVSPSLDDPTPFAPPSEVQGARTGLRRLLPRRTRAADADHAARERVREDLTADRVLVPRGTGAARLRVARFATRAFLLRTVDPAAAAQAWLHAAWLCDDDAADEAARDLRRRAARALATAQGDAAAGSNDVVRLDILRRAGEVGEARALAQALEGRADLGDVERRVVAFQRSLLERGDTASHTVDEALRATPELEAPPDRPTDAPIGEATAAPSTPRPLPRHVEVVWTESQQPLGICASRLVAAGHFAWAHDGERAGGNASCWLERDAQVPAAVEVSLETGRAVERQVLALGLAQRTPQARSDPLTVAIMRVYRFHVACGAAAHAFTLSAGLMEPIAGPDAPALQALMATILRAAGRTAGAIDVERYL